MGPSGGRFPFWRRGGGGSKAKSASGSTSGSGSGKDDGGAPRGFAAFWRGLPQADGTVRFFARDQVGGWVSWWLVYLDVDVDASIGPSIDQFIV